MSSKFYPLTHDEWLKALKELSPSEKDVLYYIRTLDPYSKGTKINASAIALEIGVNRSTVSRALKTLADKDYIDLEILTANVTIKGNGMLRRRNTVASAQQNDVAQRSQMLHEHTACCIPAQLVAATQHDTPESGSQQGTVFSKISLDLLEGSRSDRSDEIVFFENANSEISQDAIASEDLDLDDARKCDLNRVDPIDLTNTPEQPINQGEGDPFRRRVEDFILKSLQISPRDRTAYFSRFTAADWEKWEARMSPPSSPPPPPLFVPEVVEVAPPEIALANIQKIKEMLARGAK